MNDYNKPFKMKLLFYTVMSLNLLTVILFCYLCITGYFIKYPTLTLNPLGVITYGILIVVFLLPSIFSTIQLIRLRNRLTPPKRVVQIFLVCVFSVLSILSGLILVSVPPIHSYTTNITNYLSLDKDLNAYANSIENFFPKKIPHDAQDVAYSYRKYSDLFKTDATLSVSWIGSQESYLKHKQDLFTKYQLQEVAPHKYAVSFPDIALPQNLQFFIEYNDAVCSIKYLSIIQPH